MKLLPLLLLPLMVTACSAPDKAALQQVRNANATLTSQLNQSQALYLESRNDFEVTTLAVDRLQRELAECMAMKGLK